MRRRLNYFYHQSVQVPDFLLCQGGAGLARLGRGFEFRQRFIQDRALRSLAGSENRQSQAGHHEAGGEQSCCPGQQISSRPAAHEPAHAAATATAATHAKGAAFAALKKHDADKGNGQN